MAAAANLLGAAVVVNRSERGVRVLELAIAFGAGFMLSVVVLGMLPEIYGAGPAGGLWVLGGFLAVHVAQHVLTPHFHFGEETHRVSASAGASAVVGLSLHTFFDGVAIASGFHVGTGLGVLLFAAVFLHKLPEGLTVASLMLASGQGRRRALASALVPAGATLLGVLLTERVAALTTHGLALAAGVTLYVAAANLLPQFQAKRSWTITGAFFGGVAAFGLTRVLLTGAGAP